MPNSTKMLWPYPNQDQDPWYDAFVAFVAAMDSSVYMSREDRQLVIHGGGSISFTDPTLTWTAPIYVFSPATGFYAQIAAGSASITAGQVAYIDMPRSMTANQTVTLTVANQAPNTDTALVLAVRLGTQVIFRTGVFVNDGSIAALGGGSAPSLNGSTVWDPASLADGVGVTSSAIAVTGAAFGDFVLVAAPYDLQGILCTGYVSSAGNVKIRLQNETTGTIDLASGTWKVRVIK
jgi:hypothetical protein